MVWCTASYVRVPDRDTIPVKQREEKSQRHGGSLLFVLFKRNKKRTQNVLLRVNVFCQAKITEKKKSGDVRISPAGLFML